VTRSSRTKEFQGLLFDSEVHRRFAAQLRLNNPCIFPEGFIELDGRSVAGRFVCFAPSSHGVDFAERITPDIAFCHFSNFPSRYDVPRIAAPCVDYKVEHVINLPQRLNAFLAIIVAVIGGFNESWVVKDRNRLYEIYFTALPVLNPLALIPFES